MDPLLLAGVNDANFQELGRLFGVRVVFRGNRLLLSGELDQVERAVPVARHLIELSRMRTPFETTDIQRFAEGSDALGPQGLVGPEGVPRIALPGSRRVVSPKSDGQLRYLEAIAENDVVVGIGPAGQGRPTWPW